MSNTDVATTINGHEIEHPREKMSSAEFKALVSEFGLNGETPLDRLSTLRTMPMEQIALMMSDINRRVQGSEQTLVNDRTTRIGERDTIPVESRYDVFNSLITKIQNASEDINPSRIGDILGVGIVLLHPFHDGNGKTSRLMALIFKDDFDAGDYDDAYRILASSREEIRKAGETPFDGYAPGSNAITDQSNPLMVSNYLDSLFAAEAPYAPFITPYAQQSELKIAPPSQVTVT